MFKLSLLDEKGRYGFILKRVAKFITMNIGRLWLYGRFGKVIWLSWFLLVYYIIILYIINYWQVELSFYFSSSFNCNAKLRLKSNLGTVNISNEFNSAIESSFTILLGEQILSRFQYLFNKNKLANNI